MNNRAVWPLGLFSILLGYGLASLAFAQVQVPDDDEWPAEVGPQFDGQIIIDNHLTVEQRAEMLDVMNKLPKFAREHVMIADSSGDAFCNLATDPCQIEVAEVIDGEVTINGETRPVPPTQWTDIDCYVVLDENGNEILVGDDCELGGGTTGTNGSTGIPTTGSTGTTGTSSTSGTTSTTGTTGATGTNGSTGTTGTSGSTGTTGTTGTSGTSGSTGAPQCNELGPEGRPTWVGTGDCSGVPLSTELVESGVSISVSHYGWETGPFWRAINKPGYCGIKGTAKLADTSGIHRKPDSNNSYISAESADESKLAGVPTIYLAVNGTQGSSSAEGGLQFWWGWDKNGDDCIDDNDSEPNRWQHYAVISGPERRWFWQDGLHFKPGTSVVTFIGPIDTEQIASWVQGVTLTGEPLSRCIVAHVDGYAHRISMTGKNSTTKRMVTIAAISKKPEPGFLPVTGHFCGSGWSNLFLSQKATGNVDDPFTWLPFASTHLRRAVTYPCPQYSASVPCDQLNAKAPKFADTVGVTPKFLEESVSIEMGE